MTTYFRTSIDPAHAAGDYDLPQLTHPVIDRVEIEEVENGRETGGIYVTLNCNISALRAVTLLAEMCNASRPNEVSVVDEPRNGDPIVIRLWWD